MVVEDSPHRLLRNCHHHWYQKTYTLASACNELDGQPAKDKLKGTESSEGEEPSLERGNTRHYIITWLGCAPVEPCSVILSPIQHATEWAKFEVTWQ